MTKKIGHLPPKPKLIRNQEIIDLYKRGESIPNIARKIKLTGESVRMILDKQGLSASNTMKERNQKIIALHDRGRSVEQLIKEFGLSFNTIKSILIKSGMYKPHKAKAERNNMIVDLYKNGKTMREISEKVNLGYYSVKAVLVKNGVYKSTLLPKHLLIERNNKIIELYKKGNNLNQIAKPLKLNRETVRYVLIQKGIYRYPGLYDESKTQRNNRIVELYIEGKPLKEISSIVKLSYYPIKNLLINKGLYVSHRLTNKLTFKRNKKIVTLYKKGKSPARIAEAMHLEYSSVRQILIKAGIYTFNAPRDRSGNEIRNKEIGTLYKSGKSLTVIAQKMDLCPAAIRDILIKQNLYKLYAYSHLNDERNKRIVDLYKKGHSIYSIADSLNVCYNTIRNTLINKNAYTYIQKRTKRRFKRK